MNNNNYNVKNLRNDLVKLISYLNDLDNKSMDVDSLLSDVSNNVVKFSKIYDIDNPSKEYYDLSKRPSGKSEVKLVNGYWTDSNNNTWSSFIYSERDANYASMGLYNSSNCNDCLSCTNCNGCENCEGCKNCTNCISCTKCNDCSNCEFCYKLIFEDNEFNKHNEDMYNVIF